MQSNLTKYIITAIVIVIIVMGGSIIWGIFSKDNLKTADQVLGTTEISGEQLTIHNSPNDCWVVLGGVVYNATTVISENPEHKNILASACGQDGSAVYSIKKFTKQDLTEQQISKLNSQLMNYKVGLLAP